MKILERIKDFITKYMTITHFLLILGFIIIGFGLFFVIRGMHKSKIKRLNSEIANNDNITHFVVDLLNKSVYLFKKNNLENARTISLEEFLNHYSGKNQESLNRWLFNQLNTKISAAKYIKLTHYKKNMHEYFDDVYAIEKVDTDRHVLHVDCISFGIRSKKSSDCPYIKNFTELDRMFYRMKKSDLVTIALISFFPCSVHNKYSEYSLDSIVYFQLFSTIIHLLNKNCYLSVQSNGDIALIIINYDFAKDNIIMKINEYLHNYYVINNMKIDDYNICVSKLNVEKSDYKSVLKQLKQFSHHLIASNDTSNHVYYYDDSHRYDTLEVASINKETKDAINNNLFNYTYKFVLNSKNGSIDSFIAMITPFSETISNHDLFLDSILSQNLATDYLKMIINTLSKDINGRFEDTTKAKKLSRKVSFDFSPSLIQSISDNLELFRSYSDIEFTFILKNSDINDSMMNQDNFIESLSKIKEPNIKFRLELDVLTMPSKEIMNIINSVSFSNTFVRNITEDNKNHILFSNMLLSFLSSKKTLLAYDMIDWLTIETLICNNVLLFSGDVFETKNSINPLISKRITSKLKEIYTKYY